MKVSKREGEHTERERLDSSKQAINHSIRPKHETQAEYVRRVQTGRGSERESD